MRTICRAGVFSIACLWLLGVAKAQSTDSTTPLPVRSNEVTATIAARDLGDARLTDHFYAFTGTPGDLLITVDSRNMNGDVDVFTATGLRPLLKFTVYEGTSGPITKSVYLRQREDLILRVEARTPNDDDGVYRIHFGGAFEPIAGEAAIAERETNSTEPSVTGAHSGKKGRKVSSAGARIEEPPEPTVAAAPTPEPTPEPTAVQPAETPKPATTKTARNPRNRRGARGSRSTPTTKPEQSAETATTESAATTPSETPAEPATETKPAPRRRGARRGATATARKTEPVPAPEPNTGPRLVIETDDGTLIEHYMTTVRRITVENGLVVILGKDGRVQRVQLANIVRMLIAP